MRKMSYKKSHLLFLVSLVFLLAFVCVKSTDFIEIIERDVSTCPVVDLFEKTTTKVVVKNNEEVASNKRTIKLSSCERDLWIYDLSDKDYEVLLRIVEAEAGGEDETGKLLVANVVLNRVESEKFPDTVEEVVFQKEGNCYQFSPVGNGRYESVCISDETYAAVDRALQGEDLSEGALYFVSEKYADPEKLEWFHQKLTLLYSHGGHNFYG